MGEKSAHAFAVPIIIPGYQDLAAGRRWHLFFAWIAALCWLAWLISSAIKGNLSEMLLRPSDLRSLADAGLLLKVAQGTAASRNL